MGRLFLMASDVCHCVLLSSFVQVTMEATMKYCENIFFIHAHSMMEMSERNEINKLKARWSNLTIACSEYEKLTDSLHNKIIPCITGCGIKKY